MAEKQFTNEDHLLFNKIATDIKKNPEKYREAGKWLDEYCTEDSFRQRIKERLQAYEAAGAPFEREAEILRFMLEEEAYQTLDMLHKMDIERESTQDSTVKIAYLKAFLVLTKKIEGGTALRYLWFDTMDFFTKHWPNAPFLSSQNARRVLLMTWLITDPDSSGLNITKFEQLPWEERCHLSSHTLLNTIGGLPDPSREGEEQQWMKAIRIAWDKIEAEKPAETIPASGEKTKTAQATPETEPENKNTIKEQDETLPKRLQELRWFLRKENWRKHWKLILLMIIFLLFVAVFSWFVVPYINNRIRPDGNPTIQAPRMPQTPHRSNIRPAVNQTELGPLKVWKPQLEGVNTPANYKKTSPSSQTKIIDPNRNSP